MFSGEYDILDSGMAIAYDQESGVGVDLKAGNDFQATIIVHVKNNGGKLELIKNIDLSNNTVTITCFNFGAGAGTAEPINLGTADGRKIYLHLWAYNLSPNSGIYKVEYTFFWERKVS